MASIKETIVRVDSCKPNAFTDAEKTEWLSDIEGKIAADVMLMSIDDISLLKYKWPEDAKTELLVRFPHDDIYELWLAAMIDYQNGEYNKYQNSMEMYNEAYRNFVRWFVNTYHPAEGYRRRD